MPVRAPPSSTAEETSVSNTVCRSNAERLITFSTSAVAVCMLQRLGEVARARLHLVEQARVLDRDDGLVGEGLDEFDFPVAESDRLVSRHAENADRLHFADQGHPQPRPVGRAFPNLPRIFVVELREVGDVHDVSFAGRPGRRGISVEPPGRVGEVFAKRLRNIAVECARNEGRRPFAERSCRGSPRARRTAVSISVCRTESQIERRAADDLQHVGGRGLLLQRLRQIARPRLHLVEQAHVLDGDHGLIGEGLEEVDLALGEWASLPTCDHEYADNGIVALHRDSQRRAKVKAGASEARRYLRIDVRIIEQVGNAMHLAGPDHALGSRAAARPDRAALEQVADVFGARARNRLALESVVAAQIEKGRAGAAKYVGRTRPAYRAPFADRTRSG